MVEKDGVSIPETGSCNECSAPERLCSTAGRLKSPVYLLGCHVFPQGWEWCGLQSCRWKYSLAPELTALAMWV